MATTPTAPQAPTRLQQDGDDTGDIVKLQTNIIDAREMQGGYNSWQFKGDGDGIMVNPAKKMTPKITLQPDSIACYSGGGTVDTYEYEPPKQKGSKSKADDDKSKKGSLRIYTQDETIVLTGQSDTPSKQ